MMVLVIPSFFVFANFLWEQLFEQVFLLIIYVICINFDCLTKSIDLLLQSFYGNSIFNFKNLKVYALHIYYLSLTKIGLFSMRQWQVETFFRVFFKYSNAELDAEDRSGWRKQQWNNLCLVIWQISKPFKWFKGQ